MIWGIPYLASSSLVLACHHSFASLNRYFMVIVTCSFWGILTAMKYCFITHKKFCKSFAIHTLLKGLKLRPSSFVEATSITVDLVWMIAGFSNVTSSSSDYILALNSSIVALTPTMSLATLALTNLSCPSNNFL